ncbi:MAG: hypothetical protein RIR88_302 [Actinomycetota bacterium]
MDALLSPGSCAYFSAIEVYNADLTAFIPRSR